MASTSSRDSAVRHVAEAYERFMHQLQAQRTPDVVDIGISMAQLKVLHVVAFGDGLAVSQLAARVGTSPSTVSELVERLVEQGLVDREAVPTDRRQVVVTVTPAGVELMDRFRELGRRQLDDLVGRIAAPDLVTVTRAFDILERAAADLASSHDGGVVRAAPATDPGRPS